ncbi:hypothetical protein E2C01_090657 [Portunus trituberculatus]|uniref:Uncharacterized protein n=1 Tax=Portunus trituberculatus TaxID=210409 RepID=A0A5B7JLG3_PORTR|nr:hypothetical protein [Portunus trituberculatus]
MAWEKDDGNNNDNDGDNKDKASNKSNDKDKNNHLHCLCREPTTQHIENAVIGTRTLRATSQPAMHTLSHEATAHDSLESGRRTQGSANNDLRDLRITELKYDYICFS